MPYTHDWYISDQVAYVRFWGDVTAREVGEAVLESALCTTQTTADQCHFLHNWAGVTQLPTQVQEIMPIIRNRQTNKAKRGWVVAYGTNNRVFAMLGTMFFQIIRVKFRIFQTAEEAITFLRSVDPSLPEFTEPQHDDNNVVIPYKPPSPTTNNLAS